MDEEDDSPVCFAHMLVDGHLVDPQAAHDVSVFRKAERQRLYALRKQSSVAERQQMAGVITRMLQEEIGDFNGKTIAVYWPIRGELDLRPFMAMAVEAGATIALPVVIEKNAPLEFHRWTPSMAMEKGIWNILVPKHRQAVQPEIVISPLVGIDDRCYRLGNGGGYYDRTLARLPADTLIIGVGQPFCRVKIIFPQPWDIPMTKAFLADGSVINPA